LRANIERLSRERPLAAHRDARTVSNRGEKPHTPNGRHYLFLIAADRVWPALPRLIVAAQEIVNAKHDSAAKQHLRKRRLDHVRQLSAVQSQ